MSKRASDMVVSRSKRIKFDDPVRIEVGTGEDARSFIVHGSVLTSRSLFFKKALSGSWKEAEERVVKLPEDDGDTFELYLQCVYGQKMSVEPDPVPKDYTGSEERLELAKVYVFAERVQDVRTKNVAIKAFLQNIWKLRSGRWYYPSRKTLKLIYEGTVSGCPLRRLLVDIHAYATKPELTWDDTYPREFLSELALELKKANRAGPLEKRNLRWGDSADKYLVKEEEEG